MASIDHRGSVRVPAAVAWDFLARYSRAEVHVFSACIREYLDGDDRVVVLADGTKVRERNVTVDVEQMRAAYTVVDFLGAEHHQAEMRVEDTADGVVLVWCTDVLPHSLADVLRDTYASMFGELLAAVDAHTVSHG
jgi:hypothetical protein